MQTVEASKGGDWCKTVEPVKEETDADCRASKGGD